MKISSAGPGTSFLRFFLCLFVSFFYAVLCISIVSRFIFLRRRFLYFFFISALLLCRYLFFHHPLSVLKICFVISMVSAGGFEDISFTC